MSRGEVSLELARLVLRFSPLRSGKVFEKDFDTLSVRVEGLLEDIRAFKLYLICLWRREREELKDSKVEFYISRSRLSRFLGNEDMETIERALMSLRGVRYLVKKKENEKEKEFLVFGILDSAYYNSKEGYLRIEVPRVFYELCIETGLRIFTTFVPFMRSRTEINLFIFFSVDYRLSQKRTYREEVLFEKAGLKEELPDKEKRRYIKRALDELKNIGYIKDYAYKDKEIETEFYPIEEVRLRAIELGKTLSEREQKTLLRRRENKRRERQRKGK